VVVEQGRLHARAGGGLRIPRRISPAILAGPAA
jgi:hypothetical protein